MQAERILWATNLSKSHDGRTSQFSNLSIDVPAGAKLALLGRSGVGKSTLLSILAGVTPPDEGSVTLRRGASIAYVSQDLPQVEAENVLEAVMVLASRYTNNEAVRAALRYASVTARVQNELGDDCLQLLADATAHMDETSGAWEMDSYMNAALSRLQVPLDVPLSKLSGGQKRRIAIAAALVAKPDVLLLDEVTNHLSIDAVQFVEEVLADPSVTVLAISHDRWFVDRVCVSGIWELEGKLFRYGAGYDAFLEQKSSSLEREEKLVSDLAKAYRKELEWMKRQPKARGSKSKARIADVLKMQEQLKVRKNRLATAAVKDLRTTTSRLGSDVVHVENVSLKRGDTLILKDFSYRFERGERMGIVGGNGVGKSSFIEMLLGKIAPESGEIHVGETVKFGHFDQEGGDVFQRLSEASRLAMKGGDLTQVRVVDYVRELLAEYGDADATAGGRDRAAELQRDGAHVQTNGAQLERAGANAADDAAGALWVWARQALQLCALAVGRGEAAAAADCAAAAERQLHAAGRGVERPGPQHADDAGGAAGGVRRRAGALLARPLHAGPAGGPPAGVRGRRAGGGGGGQVQRLPGGGAAAAAGRAAGREAGAAAGGRRGGAAAAAAAAREGAAELQGEARARRAGGRDRAAARAPRAAGGRRGRAARRRLRGAGAAQRRAGRRGRRHRAPHRALAGARRARAAPRAPQRAPLWLMFARAVRARVPLVCHRRRARLFDRRRRRAPRARPPRVRRQLRREPPRAAESCRSRPSPARHAPAHQLRVAQRAVFGRALPRRRHRVLLGAHLRAAEVHALARARRAPAAHRRAQRAAVRAVRRHGHRRAVRGAQDVLHRRAPRPRGAVRPVRPRDARPDGLVDVYLLPVQVLRAARHRHHGLEETTAQLSARLPPLRCAAAVLCVHVHQHGAAVDSRGRQFLRSRRHVLLLRHGSHGRQGVVEKVHHAGTDCAVHH
ncbi:ABC transporter [Gracilaria domingensis]|nr:ABC transporter [Gracilaria domingensis]